MKREGGGVIIRHLVFWLGRILMFIVGYFGERGSAENASLKIIMLIRSTKYAVSHTELMCQ